MEEVNHLTPWFALWVTTFACCSLIFNIQVQGKDVLYDLDQDEIVSLLWNPEPIDSGPPVTDIDEEAQDSIQKNRRRDVNDRGMDKEMKLLMVELHNLYRGNVTPPAADMSFLEWDQELGDLAQMWADDCKFDHGTPDIKYSGKGGKYGQNLYMGMDPSGKHAVWMWYEEYLDFNFHNLTCPIGKKCGHYQTMAASKSQKIGCGWKKCSSRRYYIVCHYFPPVYRSERLYTVGRPCSQCAEPGSLCIRNLCITKEQCKRNPQNCSEAKCNLKCQNCGRLNRDECLCECADGWDKADCSNRCVDTNIHCGKRFNKYHCLQSEDIKKKLCRNMCDQCIPFNENVTTNHICCDGKFCPDGYVLDTTKNPCGCILNCPGLLCDKMDESSDPEIKMSSVYTMRAGSVSAMSNFLVSIISLLFSQLYISMHNK